VSEDTPRTRAGRSVHDGGIIDRLLAHGGVIDIGVDSKRHRAMMQLQRSHRDSGTRDPTSTDEVARRCGAERDPSSCTMMERSDSPSRASSRLVSCVEWTGPDRTDRSSTTRCDGHSQ
jgi:hypothetical protein